MAGTRRRFAMIVWAVLLLVAPLTLAGEFHAVPVLVPEKNDAGAKAASWSRPENWSGPDHQGPTSAADVGIIGSGHELSVGDPLGKPDSRPLIQVDAGGTLLCERSFDQPLRLNGGQIQLPVWKPNLCRAAIQVTADSTIDTPDSHFGGGQTRFDGKFSNSKPVTLTLDGDAIWTADCHDTFTATIVVAHGTLLLTDTEDSGRLGRGEIRLLEMGRMLFRHTRQIERCSLTNDLSGIGTIQAAENAPIATIRAEGITIRPGVPGQGGTLAVAGDLSFQRGTHGNPYNKLVIEVHGPGTFIGHDYSQLSVRGALADTLDTVDLELLLDSALKPDEMKGWSLNVLNVGATDISGFRPFRSISVHQGDRKGSAKVSLIHDTQMPMGSVIVTDISVGG